MIQSAGRNLSGSNVDLSRMTAEAQRLVFNLLNKFEGTKTIIWDDKLIGSFEFVVRGSMLRKHDASKLFRLNDVRLALSSNTDFVLFFLRIDYNVAKIVAEALQRVDQAFLAKVSLVFVPQRCASIERLLEVHKIELKKLNSIEELAIELFVMDTDVLSMENEFVFRDIHLNDDYSAVHQIVEGLTKLQDLYGNIPRISGQGKAAKLVHDLLLKRRRLQPKPKHYSTRIHQLILIDRKIDLITPLITQLTYEGILDEVFGIHHGTITLPAEPFIPKEPQQDSKAAERRPEPTTKGTKKFELRSSEELYAKLRDCHINGVAETLGQSQQNLIAEREQCNSEGKTIHEMGKIVKRISNLKIAESSQSNHLTMAKLVNEQTLKPEFIYGLRTEHAMLQEEGINRVMAEIETKLLRQENPMHVLRLICLQSMINNGLRPKISDYYKKEMIQNYGDEYLLFLMLLERAHILLSQEKFHDTATFSQLKSRFNLINDKVDERNPNHLSYVYGGYAPLSVMVAKTLAQISSQLRPADSLKLLPEPTILYSEPSSSSNQPATGSSTTFGSSGTGGSGFGEPSSASSVTGSAITAASLLLSSASAAAGGRVRRNSATSSLSSSSEESRNVLVFFIGGCTFAEISALRFLSQQEENNCDFIVATTKIVNGSTFLKSLWPHTTGTGPKTAQQV